MNAKRSPSTALATSTQAVNPKKLEATIEQMYFQNKSVTTEQKAIFAHAVNRTGLDPIVGQIRPVLRETRNGPQMAIQTSIDGYRLIADRTGMYAGNDDPVYQYANDKALDHPEKATVTVWKLVQGQRCGFTATARWSEYFPKLDSQQFMWRKMPYLMLAKCAEALALRKAFPADLSGVYTDDEMHQAGGREEDPVVETPVVSSQPITKKQPTRIQVMEYLTACKTPAQLEQVMERARAYLWPPEDKQVIRECYERTRARLETIENEEVAMLRSELEGKKVNDSVPTPTHAR